ncbi:hypothetical protein P2318_18175 [Myxococcaceae bacterium GXIMD 01537]
MSVPEPRKDPRYRPFRAAAYGVHIAVSTVFSLWIIVNVSRSVAAMTPERQPPAPTLLSYRECLDAAQDLWADLEREREKLVRTQPARDVAEEWMRARTAWLERVRAREAQCGLKSRDRVLLQAVYQRMERVLDLYTIHAVQYAGEVGHGVDALQDAFEAARRSPEAGGSR